MDRRNFLHSQILMLAATAACGLQACSKTSISPPMSESEIDLEKELLVPGSWLRFKSYLLIRMRPGFEPDCFEALQSSCPHAGGNLEWNAQQQQIICPVHGSRFSAVGDLLLGPAAVPLERFSIRIREGRYLTVL
jgi:hypothetical protein